MAIRIGGLAIVAGLAELFSRTAGPQKRADEYLRGYRGRDRVRAEYHLFILRI